LEEEAVVTIRIAVGRAVILGKLNTGTERERERKESKRTIKGGQNR
jgi:hypothetical protein